MMYDSTHIVKSPRLAYAPGRTAPAILAMVALALLVPACGGRNPASARSGPPPSPGDTAGSSSAIAYSSCIRSHGVPNFPDPASGGGVPKGNAQEFGVSSSDYHAAQTACQHLYPASSGSIQLCETTGACPQAVVQQALALMRRYSRCIRAHGVPNWPDPSIDAEGRPYFDVSGAGFSMQFSHSALFGSKDRLCERQVGGSAGVPVPLG